MEKIIKQTSDLIWPFGIATGVFIILFIIKTILFGFWPASPYLCTAIIAATAVYALWFIRKEANKQHLTDHIEVPEVKLPTEVAALQELVRKYEQQIVYKDKDYRETLKSWKDEQELRFAAEEEARKKDFQIHELMSDNMDYLTQRDNAIKQLEELKGEIEKRQRWRRSNPKSTIPA